MPTPFRIQPYSDGKNIPPAYDEIKSAWEETWLTDYAGSAPLIFEEPLDIKGKRVFDAAPAALKEIADIRNPDLFFQEIKTGTSIGGAELTAHSPDGSNVEKRYPYLWASRRAGGVTGFIATPYQKRRASGQLNRLPSRHMQRNVEFVNQWVPGTSGLHQFVPTREMQENLGEVPERIRNAMLSWADYGRFFAHSLAAAVLEDEPKARAVASLEEYREKFREAALACIDAATHTEPSSLIKLSRHRWVQVYNTRPDSGHWERGEGQFDSIDGRLMFTLDEIDLLPEKDRPAVLELWLPQMVSQHPWVVEQRERGYGSKRFRNLLEVLSPRVSVRFSEDLTDVDRQILLDNPRLLLERLDWEPRIFKISDLAPPDQVERIARHGLKSPSDALKLALGTLLRTEGLYFSAHRPYGPGWREALGEALRVLPRGATVLVPRIPGALLAPLAAGLHVNVVPAEECKREHLLMLRQLHRVKPR